MARHMYCPGQITMTKEGKDNYDKIFDKEEEGRDTTCYCLEQEHIKLHDAGVLVCPRCGVPTDPRIGQDPTSEGK